MFHSLSSPDKTYRSPEHIVNTSLTVSTPQVFRIAGDAGGIKKPDRIPALSILPRFVTLNPLAVPKPKNLFPTNFPALLGKFPQQEISEASRSPGSRFA